VSAEEGKTSGDPSSTGVGRGVSAAVRWLTGRASRFSRLASKTPQRERTDTTTGSRDQAEPSITSAFEKELEKICIERKRLVERIGEDGNVKLEQLLMGGERIGSRLRWTEEGGAECLDILKM
jgi:hypothetical protein